MFLHCRFMHRSKQYGRTVSCRLSHGSLFLSHCPQNGLRHSLIPNGKVTGCCNIMPVPHQCLQILEKLASAVAAQEAALTAVSAAAPASPRKRLQRVRKLNEQMQLNMQQQAAVVEVREFMFSCTCISVLSPADNFLLLEDCAVRCERCCSGLQR